MRRRFIRNREAVDEYFTIESLEDECVISLTRRDGTAEGVGLVVWYSINNSHWTFNNLSKNPITLKKGYKVRFKYNSVMGTFVITKKCKILGSIMSLCFMDDFKNKTSLESRKFPELFKGCNTIVSVDKGFLPATTLSDSCYKNMFYGCTNLVEAPVLPATILTYSCYAQMFHGCTKLNYIKMLATDIPSGSCLAGWVYGVSSTGTFVKNKDATWDTTPGALGNSGVPAGWTVKNDGNEGDEITFPITLIEGDNGTTGVKFFNYVKDSKYTNEEVYIINNGFKIQTFDWGLTSEEDLVSCNSWEVVDSTNGVGRPGLDSVTLNESGILILIRPF